MFLAAAILTAVAGLTMAPSTAATAAAPSTAAMAAPASDSAVSPAALRRGCITWVDHAGPGHGERRHVKCAHTGLYVMVFIYCNTGNASSPGFRHEYNKAECPGYGGRATRGWDVEFAVL
jgi:hypothetical protein